MKKIIAALIIGATLIPMTSCSDFLEEQPEQLVAENYFESADMCLAYMLRRYSDFPVHDQWTYRLGTFTLDNGTDMQINAAVSNTKWQSGQWKVPENSAGNWTFTNVRYCNFFLNYVLPRYEAGEISGSDANIRQAIGEAYFFRAYNNWNNYKEIGDFPIVEELLPDNQEVLLEAVHRMPRNVVARHILADLTTAASYLPETNYAGKQRINKACAELLRSRVALFEGTWLKFHKGTALVPGGPGWPGDPNDLQGYNIDTEIAYFLGEAMTSAKAVGDRIINNLAENTATEEGYNQKLQLINPYYGMFTETNLDGYAEVLAYKTYNLDVSSGSTINQQFQRNGGGVGLTRGMLNSFVMQNGLPIYAAGSGYDEAWENNGISATLKDRDNRAQIFLKGDTTVLTYWDNGEIGRWNQGICLIYAGADESNCPTAVALKKGQLYGQDGLVVHAQDTQGSILFRATEALLNYMEACVELNGSVDGTADTYWKALRTRAKVDPDYTKTIAATNMAEEAKLNFAAYSGGQYVTPLQFNVRRERACELMSEGHRMNDIRRWRAIDQVETTPFQVEGLKYWGTVYEYHAADGDNYSPLVMRNQSGDPYEAIVDVEGGTGNMSSLAISGPYIHPFQISKQNLLFNGFTWKHGQYLSPLGQKNLSNASMDNDYEKSVIYQNPGWPEQGNQPCGDI